MPLRAALAGTATSSLRRRRGPPMAMLPILGAAAHPPCRLTGRRVRCTGGVVNTFSGELRLFPDVRPDLHRRGQPPDGPVAYPLSALAGDPLVVWPGVVQLQCQVEQLCQAWAVPQGFCKGRVVLLAGGTPAWRLPKLRGHRKSRTQWHSCPLLCLGRAAHNSRGQLCQCVPPHALA